MTCRRCAECEGLDHHWLPFADEATGRKIGPPMPDYTCKHCPAVADECPMCDGDGVDVELYDPGSEEDLDDCPWCEGSGIIERKPGRKGMAS